MVSMTGPGCPNGDCSNLQPPGQPLRTKVTRRVIITLIPLWSSHITYKKEWGDLSLVLSLCTCVWARVCVWVNGCERREREVKCEMGGSSNQPNLNLLHYKANVLVCMQFKAFCFGSTFHNVPPVLLSRLLVLTLPIPEVTNTVPGEHIQLHWCSTVYLFVQQSCHPETQCTWYLKSIQFPFIET